MDRSHLGCRGSYTRAEGGRWISPPPLLHRAWSARRLILETSVIICLGRYVHAEAPRAHAHVFVSSAGAGGGGAGERLV